MNHGIDTKCLVRKTQKIPNCGQEEEGYRAQQLSNLQLIQKGHCSTIIYLRHQHTIVSIQQ